MIANHSRRRAVGLLSTLLVLAAASTALANLGQWWRSEADVCSPWPSQCSEGCPPAHAGQAWTGSDYAPQYRSTWKRVPVTLYQPVTQRDALTGVSHTHVAPCNTFEWQPDRRRRLSLQQRPCYRQSYNMDITPSWATSVQAEEETAVEPYYDQGETRLVPAPTEPSTSEPADRPPRLGPDESSETGSAANSVPPRWLAQRRSASNLRGLSSGRSLLPLSPASSDENRAASNAPTTTRAAHAPDPTIYELTGISTPVPDLDDIVKPVATSGPWDDQGWKSLHD